mmetsp:Transcript_77133/g.121810  ORF Transcript_77133/g.121810 Transcript_77133/m.121810 type:complete len:188 (+) Transcript_77133:35-598(+)|eukprot:CAMPEP_0169118362 /NCGR_PEP_ID=MMETSP1015-20121227/30957_1 /TAXON_ID=342587 /ORGANISM="Karlodinium micrum, Strain CCMP2283" /LENGTH=187 /DNA_ID=CAMNT_0009181119 /DNA_START=32 /DNA_END=595 /DNA_ORIENTATION=-
MGDFAVPVTRRRVKPVAKDVAHLKVFVVGDAEVGKSAFVQNFCNEQLKPSGSSQYEPTIGAEFQAATLVQNSKEMRINIWDLGGNSEFLEVREEFYKESQAGILAFDVTARKSFQNLETWLGEARRYGSGDLQFVVVALKVDAGPRVVNEQAARDWAKGKGFVYFEVSAALGKNVDAPFKELASRVA